MRSLRHFLSIFTVLALISGPALVAHAQDAPDNQQYDSPANAQPDNESAEPDNQPLPEAQPAPEPDYDQQSNQQAPAAPTYDDQAEVAQNNQQPPVDPPARAARLQFMTGSVSVQPQGTGEWVAGELNRPLTNSDNIWADKDSRAEISLGAGLIRIGSESSLTLTNIGENTVQVQLHQGALSLHVRRLYDGEKYEVDTPNQAFTVEKPGDYRFDVNPDADKTIITVWRGEGESTGDGSPVRIHANEQVRFSNGTSLSAEVHGAPAPDSFDQWAQQRDEKLDNSQSAKYVSPDMVGGDDLDEYGVWKETPDYGAVWYPSVGPGWAPYYNGHWVYEYPWGWTWVDYEPWGFAPFHYGRWVYWGGGWGWAPGPIYARPYYAPALVAWFGGGVGIGFGWCPLGWGEPFIPWYGVSRGYFYRVNFTNGRFYGRFHDLNGFYGRHFVNGRFGGRGFDYHYANFRRPGGFTMASRTTIVNSLSVSRNNIRVSSSAMSRMSAIHSFQVRPTRASIAGSRGGRAAVPPQRAFARPVVSRMSAPNRGALNRGSLNHGSFNQGPSNRGSFNQGSFNRGSANVASRGGFNGAARPGFNGNVARPSGAVGANRGPVFNNSRGPQGPSMGARGVPRPPNAGAMPGRGMGGGNAGRVAGNTGRFSPQMNSRSSVPRPTSPSMGRSAGPAYSPRGATPNYSPRSAGPSSPRGGFSAPRQTAPQSRGPRGAMRVPRPSPSVAAANRSYTNQAYNRGSFGGSYGRSSAYDGGRSMGSYGSRSYGSPARPSPSYGGGSYGRAQSYGGGRSAYNGGFGGRTPSYGGSVSRAPSYSGGRSAGSFGGGRSAGSFGGGRSMGGGGRSGGFGGGGHFGGGGGGGGHFGGGGGGHSGGGGHGGHR